MLRAGFEKVRPRSEEGPENLPRARPPPPEIGRGLRRLRQHTTRAASVRVTASRLRAGGLRRRVCAPEAGQRRRPRAQRRQRSLPAAGRRAPPVPHFKALRGLDGPTQRLLGSLHAIDARRLRERRSWLVCFSNSRPFGPRRGRRGVSRVDGVFMRPHRPLHDHTSVDASVPRRSAGRPTLRPRRWWRTTSR